MSEDSGARADGPTREQVASAYRAYAAKLRRIIHNKVGSTLTFEARASDAERGPRAVHEVDDLVHEVFARLLAPRSVGLSRERDPIPYLVTMALNLHRDLLRKRRRQSAGLGGEHLRETRVLASVAPSALEDHELQRRAQLELIAVYVAALPTELSVVYEARYVRGLSQQVTAGLLGVSRRQVRTLEARVLSGALQALAEGTYDAGAARSCALLETPMRVESRGPFARARRIPG